MLEKRSDKLTEDVLKAAVANEWSGWAVTKLLLFKGCDTITEGILEAAAGNWTISEKVLSYLRKLYLKGNYRDTTE